MKANLLFTVLILPAFVFNLSKAQNWTGAVDSDWNNPSNWTGWPLAGEDLLIDTLNYGGAKASPAIINNSVFAPDEIIVQGGASLVINASLSVVGNIEILGNNSDVTINGGSVHIISSGGGSGRLICAESGMLHMNSGTLMCDERLIAETGGAIHITGGSVTTELLAIADGNLVHNSWVTITGGIVNINDELAIENETGNFSPVFLMGGGNLNINGAVSALGVAPGSGKAKFIFHGGQATINGPVSNDPLSTVNMNFIIENSAVLNLNTSTVSLAAGDSLIQEASAQLHVSNSNWINNGVMRSEGEIIFTSDNILDGNGEYTFHRLYLQNGCTLQHVSPKKITVRENIIANGIFVPAANTVYLNGDSTQTFSGTSAIGFSSLALNKNSHLVLNTGITIADTLLCYKGKIISNSLCYPTFEANAVALHYSDSSFIEGPAVKIGNSTFEFPIGRNTRLAPIAVSAAEDSATTIQAEFFDNAYVDTVSMAFPLSSINTTQYWAVNEINGSDSLTLTFKWSNAGDSGIDSCQYLSLANWLPSAGEWKHLSASVTGSCSNASPGAITAVNPFVPSGFYTTATEDFTLHMQQPTNPEVNLAKVYPNPLSSYELVNIQSKNPIEHISVIDAQGRIIKSTNEAEPFQLERGVYLLQLRTADSYQTFRLIVN